MEQPQIQEQLAFGLYEKNPGRIKDLQHFKYALRHCDRGLYLKFRDHQITYDQFLARVEQLRFGTKYSVLDDVKPILKPSYLDKPDDEQMYQTYMEVVKASMDQERKALRSSNDNKGKTDWRIKKEAAAIPVGKHCVRSLYTFFDK